jgi:hypothetical protein
MKSTLALSVLLPAVPAIVLAGSAKIPPKSGAAMCALTPADFQSVGVTNTSKPAANVQDGGASAYCVYAGKSSATGGVELDVFYPAGGSSIADAKETLRMAIGEGSSAQTPLKPTAIAGADEAYWSPAAKSGGPTFATMAVRRGTLVFVVGIPARATAETQLTKLVAMVLQRF